MFYNDNDRLVYLNYLASSMNLSVNMEMLEINKMIYQSNEKRNQEILELLKEIKNGKS